MGNNNSRRRQGQGGNAGGGGMVKGARECELLECPICLEVPDGKIWQCGNGHSLCDTCSKAVDDLCPQCRMSLKVNNKVRNRAMERFLSGMMVDCKYKKQGCKVAMSREKLKAHQGEDCEFSPVKRVNICKSLGYPNCEFLSRRAERLYRHFVDQHRVGHVIPNLKYTFGLGRLEPTDPTPDRVSKPPRPDDKNYNFQRYLLQNTNLRLQLLQ